MLIKFLYITTNQIDIFSRYILKRGKGDFSLYVGLVLTIYYLLYNETGSKEW
jgi:hypothetical protein